MIIETHFHDNQLLKVCKKITSLLSDLYQYEKRKNVQFQGNLSRNPFYEFQKRNIFLRPDCLIMRLEAHVFHQLLSNNGSKKGKWLIDWKNRSSWIHKCEPLTRWTRPRRCFCVTAYPKNILIFLTKSQRTFLLSTSNIAFMVPLAFAIFRRTTKEKPSALVIRTQLFSDVC